MSATEIKTGHGGYREGAGRKPANHEDAQEADSTPKVLTADPEPAAPPTRPAVRRQTYPLSSSGISKLIEELGDEIERVRQLQAQMKEIYTANADADLTQDMEVLTHLLAPVRKAGEPPVREGDVSARLYDLGRSIHNLSSAAENVNIRNVQAQSQANARYEAEQSKLATEKAEADRIRALLAAHPA